MELPGKNFDSQVPCSGENQPDELERTQSDGQEVGLVEEALGDWDIKYPGSDGMIREDYIERLELRRDYTYTWSPPPAWAPSSGVWGVIKTKGGLKLFFKDNYGRSRFGFLVFMSVEEKGPWYMSWTRTRGDIVICSDRIWRADRPRSH